MEHQIVLALMQLRGISRKTVQNKLTIPEDSPCTKEGLLSVFANSNTFHASYSAEELIQAIEKSNQILADCEKLSIQVTTFLDDTYPKRFHGIPDPPAVIYYQGDIKKVNTVSTLAIIGTREPLEYGRKAGFRLGELFAQKGYADVSGLALGCDTVGHEGCLSQGGYTVAIMGGGLQDIYPKKNKELGQRILDTGGCLLSEYAPYTNMFKNMFVERDRLQAALSDGVIVVETGIKGGTLHTVQFAQELGKPVAALIHPPELDKAEKVQGNKMLIREKNVIPLFDSNDIEAFCTTMEEAKEKRLETQSAEIYEQLSLFPTKKNGKKGKK